MAHASEVAMESVESVRFGFMTDEELRRHSFVKITSPMLVDTVERPVPGGLYDPAMGPLDERTPCKSCGQRSLNCAGHCGHIDLVSPVYNPLLFNTLYKLLKSSCIFCHHFLVIPEKIEKCISSLDLVLKGDVTGAEELDESEPDDGSKYLGAEHMKHDKWTSLQFTRAMSSLNGLLKLSNGSKCKHCESSVPKIRKPTFGWLYMERLAESLYRANIIKGTVSEGPLFDEDSSPEEEIIDDRTSQEHGSTSNGQATPEKATKEKGSKANHARSMQIKSRSGGPFLPTEVREHLKLLWETEAQFFNYLNDIQHQGLATKLDYSMFFLDTLLVPPIKFRPPSKGSMVAEHPHTVLLSKVIEANITLGNGYGNKLEYSKIILMWMKLQQSVNAMFDNKNSGNNQKDAYKGIIQVLERKEGLFRQKMMGKRVNYACRSVISPDPYLAVNEIGIPPYFALRLTYPERVTPWNVSKLRNAIVNGPLIHPGATHYIDKSSTVKLTTSRKARISASRKLPSSRGAVIQDGKSYDNETEGKVVYRHLQDGDIVLVNRQPTLHKPSIMAHVVRVLKGEKTIRMHYANCSTYNADFDGDEMNVHFPQDEISRAEGYNILNANNQFVKPTSGEPIRALIQDHIISAVLLSKKDTFLKQDEFQLLLFSSGLSSQSPNASSQKLGDKVSVPNFESEIQLLPPAIWKPVPLWTGKQVITALLNHITKGSLPFSVEKSGKIPRDFFSSGTVEEKKSRKKDDGSKSKRRKADKDGLNTKEELDEDILFIYKNTFVRGVIDKGQFGEYGLVHTVQELYGSNTAGVLLSAFSRLFTVYLQMHGFTCGVADLLIMERNDKGRKRTLEKCEDIGKDVHRKFVGVKDKNIDPRTLTLKIEKTIRDNGEAALASLDRKMISQLNDITSNSEELKGLLSKGLYKIPSKNCISLMTTSGAKGGIVNFQQISSHLGQQELEGKRVPRMISGKTLPCFAPWDWASRSGGLIVDRFLSGLRPQEYYFHCMAGREGLVDTAVKTSRSGYLQRCLIKNLESLKVNYDHTVRDADGSIIQFYYGEDGVDVHQISFLSNFEAVAANEETISKRCSRQIDKSDPYIVDLPIALKKKAMQFINKTRGSSSQGNFLKLIEHKYLTSLAQPGEPVGVLAAQSVGEPSTQMTLNTFHLAGRGEMNVTLGIPRLQEILMTAGADIKTPFMTCPLQLNRSEEDAKLIVNGLKNISVADVLEGIKVSVEPFAKHGNEICRIYELEMKCSSSELSSESWKETLEYDFVRAIEDDVTEYMKIIKKMRGISDFKADPLGSAHDNEGRTEDGETGNITQEDDDGEETIEDLEDRDLDEEKRKRQGTDEMEYEGDSEVENNEGEEDLKIGSDSENDRNDEEDVEKDGEIVPEEYGDDSKPEKEEKEDLKTGFDSENDQNDEEDVEKDGEIIPEEYGDESEPEKEEEKKKKKTKRFLEHKETDHRVSVELEGYNFTIRFKFSTREPHILLAQIAQKTAAKVFIQRSGKINDCQQITCKESQVIYYGDDPRSREEIPLKVKEEIPALQTAGVDFSTFWNLQDVLDVRYVYSNNVHAMLTHFGIEAARETIIREVTNVFKSYGISVNIRHLTLIADFMTHTGDYRPMNRHGGISDSTSPFGKMSFETASKFIVEAAYHRQLDDLETPSSRICLGLPVKVGTGCFDLLQKWT